MNYLKLRVSFSFYLRISTSGCFFFPFGEITSIRILNAKNQIKLIIKPLPEIIIDYAYINSMYLN